MRVLDKKQPHRHAPKLSEAKPPRHSGPALPAPATQVRRQMRSTQHQLALRLLSEYEGGPKPGTLEHAFAKVGGAYVHARHEAHKVPVVGTAFDVGEQAAQGSDPIPLAQALYAEATHPIRKFQHDRAAQAAADQRVTRAYKLYHAGKISASAFDATVRAHTSASIIVGGPGGFRPEVAGDIVRPRTKAEAEARIAHIDAQIEKTNKAVEKHIGHPLYGNDVKAAGAEQLRRNRINGLIDLFEKSGKRRAGTAKALRSGRKPSVASETVTHAQQHIEAAIKAHPNDPVLQHYAKLVEERNHLAAALGSHMPGETPREGAFGTVTVKRAAPAAKVEPVKVADVPNIPGLERSPEAVRGIVAQSLGPARRIYAEQKKGYGVERSVRVAKGMKAYEDAGGGMAGHAAFMRAQRGELPKEVFDRLSNGVLTQADLETLASHAYDHPDLQPYEKMNAVNALRDAIEQKRTPAPHEIELLRRAYGEPVAQALAKLPWHKLAGHHLLSALNIPRSLMASLDVSAPFRQGLVAGAGHPVIFAKNFPGMFRALKSEGSYQAILDEIHSRPTYPLMEGRVKFTELGHELNKREEPYQAEILDKLAELERKVHVPGPGRMVHASGRAYTGYLDKMRADLFDQMYERLQKKGRPVESEKYLNGIANYVNAATGRGSLDLGFANLESWAPFLNAAFFSPRLMASRINFLNPLWIVRLPRGVRIQAARSILQLGLGAGTALYAAHRLAGATVNMDPKNADFAKLRFGDTRMDILGGFQQYIRLAAQLYTGKMVSSTTGKTYVLGHGFGQIDRPKIAWHFLQAKLNPPAAVVNDFFNGTDYAGAPVSVKKEIYSHLVPLVAQDARDLFHNTGNLPLVALIYGISAFGIGVQTYGAKKPTHKGHGGGGSENANPLLGGGGGSNPFLPGGGSSSNPYLP